MICAILCPFLLILLALALVVGVVLYRVYGTTAEDEQWKANKAAAKAEDEKAGYEEPTGGWNATDDDDK